MPGVEGTLTCQSCDAQFEVAGGATFDEAAADGENEPRVVGYDQFECRTCKTLVSVWDAEGAAPKCKTCKNTMIPWEPDRSESDDAWGGFDHEWGGGACPRCGAEFGDDAFDRQVLWD